MEITPYIRWMLDRDLPEILAIEFECYDSPWMEEDFIRCLRQRNCIGMVAEHEDRVVGFMIYELHKHRIDITNFTVAVACHRCGVGTQMLDKMKAKLSLQRRSRLSLEVRESNLPAQLFYRDMGFHAVNVLREFYPDTDEDAYVMEFVHPEAAHAQKIFSRTMEATS